MKPTDKNQGRRGSTRSEEPRQNDVIAGWRLDRQLGVGGQATVWKARDTNEKHSPPGALKLCSPGEKPASRLKREAQLLKENPHPYIVGLREVGEYQGRPFLVMDLATASLERVADESASPGVKVLQHSPTLLLKFFGQVLEALSFLHERGIVHRDIKPSNVLLMGEQREPLRVVLSDFGIAAPIIEQGKITGNREIVGTPTYRAPEVLAGHTATPASDVFGLGRLLEFLLSRSHPTFIQPSPCPRGRELSDTLCEQLDFVIGKACAYDPDDRYVDAAEMANDLPRWQVASLDLARTRLHTSFSDDAALGLAKAIGLSDAPGAAVGVYTLRRELESGVPYQLDNYRVTMALRQLSDAGLLENAEAEDHNGELYSIVRVTDAGYAWAQSEDARLRQIASRGSYGGVSEDSDIPF